MSKNKDPAFLLYTSDFLTGVSDLTMEERGKYITLLCLQHQKGHLSNKTIKTSVGQVTQDLLDKFQKDSKGYYYNARLEEEIKKRVAYAKSRSENGKKGGRPTKAYENHMLNICKPYEKHTENENINEDISNTLDKNNIIFPFSNNNNYNNSMCNSACTHDKYENIEFEITRYFTKHDFVSNAEDFIAYNKSRAWKGIGGEDVREDYTRYADRWESEERRKRGEYDWTPPII